MIVERKSWTMDTKIQKMPASHGEIVDELILNTFVRRYQCLLIQNQRFNQEITEVPVWIFVRFPNPQRQLAVKLFLITISPIKNNGTECLQKISQYNTGICMFLIPPESAIEKTSFESSIWTKWTDEENWPFAYRKSKFSKNFTWQLTSYLITQFVGTCLKTTVQASNFGSRVNSGLFFHKGLLSSKFILHKNGERCTLWEKLSICKLGSIHF